MGFLLLGCSAEGLPGTTLGFDFAADGFYAAPFPNEHRRRDDGSLVLHDFPNPSRNSFVESLRRVAVTSADGFGRTSAIYFQADGPLGARRWSVEEVKAVHLRAIDEAQGADWPITVETTDDGGPYGAPQLLSVLPLQGRPLKSHTRYLVYVERALLEARGAELGVPTGLRQLLLDDTPPPGLEGAALEDHRAAVEHLRTQGVDLETVAGLTVFRTGAPEAGLAQALAQLTGQRPTVEAPLQLHQTFPGYCVYQGAIRVPVFQAGTPPYSDEGGAWVVAGGQLVEQRQEVAKVVVTTPRRTPPSGQHPTVLFVRTGGGGDRPLVDRGRHGVRGGPAVVPGSGPAQELAAVGWAGVSIDGPLGGRRNPNGGDEQFLIFNFANLQAMRDNLRQSALELAWLADWVVEQSVTSTACAPARLGEPLVLMGHSMGATIGPLALAEQPRFQAGIFSGAGASWIENVVHKQSPLPVRPVAEILIGYNDLGRTLGPHDPVLNLLEWAGEPADPSVYAEAITQGPAPRHVLMFQGIVDTYILPPIANTLSLSLGLDLAEPALEPSLAPLLGWVGRRTQTLPVRGNRGATQLVVQHPEDGLEDGHEVMFQTEGPKRQYRCFLQTLQEGGAPTVVPASPSDGPCR